MVRFEDLGDGAVVREIRRRGLRLDCRACESICELVISPWRCLKDKCAAVYAYEDDGTIYFGCLHKVFSAELDLASFLDAGGDPIDGPDPYGPLRVVAVPRSYCRVSIERAYEGPRPSTRCSNPAFIRQQGRQDR